MLGDNFETSVISSFILFQILNAAASFNFGYKYREAFYKNVTFMVFWGVQLVFLSWLIIADPNWVGCQFRMNCGNTEVLKAMGYETSFEVEVYNSPLGHNVMPVGFRWRIWGMCVANMVAVLWFEKFVVLGKVGEELKRRFGGKWEKVRLEY